MGKLFRSISAEHRKLWGKRSNCFYFGVVFFLTFMVSLYIWAVGSDSSIARMPLMQNRYAKAALSLDSYSSDNWSAEVSEDISAWSEELAALSAKKQELAGTNSEYTVETRIRELERDIAVYTRYLDRGTAPSDSKAFDSAIFAMWMMLPVIGLLSLFAVSDLFAGEFSRGTINVILSRPVTRIKQYIAKLFTSFLYSSLLMSVTFVVAMAACGIFIGGENSLYVGYRGGAVYETTLAAHCAEVLLCFIGALAVIIALCAMLGNMTHSRTVSAGLPFAIMCVSLFFGDALGALGFKVIGITIFANLDLASALCFIPNYSGIGFTTCAISLAVHFIIFVIAGYHFFKKDIR